MRELRNPLLLWWIQIVVTSFAFAVTYYVGWIDALYDADITKISFIILGLFVVASAATGYMSVKHTDLSLRPYADYIWFIAESMTALGMIGTVIGFLIVLGTAFSGLDVQEAENIQAAISNLAIGMSTALVTTLVGLICNLITKLQIVVVEIGWDQDEKKQV